MFKRKRFGIRGRLTATISVVAVVAVATMAIVIALRVGSLARDSALQLAAQTAGRFGNDVKATVEEALNQARGLARVFEGAGAMADLDLSRRQANGILKYFIEHSSQFTGVYAAFEPNAFDDRDDNFIDEWGHDGTGRFVPYWTRDDNGEGKLRPLVDYDKEGAGEYYLASRRTKREAVIGPKVYQVQGKDVLMVSLVVPILDLEKRFIGVVGVDKTTEGLQKMVAETVLFRSGAITLYSPKGFVIAARDPSIVGKPVSALVKDQTFAGRVVRPDGKPAEAFTVERRLDSGVVAFSIGVPVAIGETGTPWLAVADIPRAEVLAPVNGVLAIIVIVGLLAIVVFVAATAMLARSIAAPLVRVWASPSRSPRATSARRWTSAAGATKSGSLPRRSIRCPRTCARS